MAASAAVSASLSELDPYRLSNVRQTGRTVGVGAYGNVVEVAIPGALCAAKKVHDFFLDPGQTPPEGIHKSMREFVNECKRMSTLRHPHIVQFLGVCDLPGSRIPALVMEKLVTSLHDILDPEPKPTTKPYIPVGLKCSILHNVASGVSFMHSQTPPIIHRDLSAKNVLLTEGMVAKVADLGMARNVPSLQAALMTKTPGAPIYMPPEAVQDESLYDITIDIFSLGVLALFTLSQMFPDPLSATYVDSKSGKVVGRTELERRWKYMQEVRKQFQQGHPLIKMIEGCLKDSIEERPKIDQILRWLTQTRAEANVDFIDGHKLVLIQALQSKTEELRAKDEHIALRIQQNEIQKEQLEYRVAQVNYLEVQVESLLQQPQKRSSCSRAERHAKSQGVVLLEEDEADPRPISELGSKEPKQSLFKEGVTPTRMMQQNAPVTTARGGFTYHELLLQDAGVIDQEQAKEVTQLPTASATSGGENGGQVSSTRLILVGDMSVKLRKTSSPIYRELGKARGALTATAAAPVKQAEEDTSKPLFTGHSHTGKPPVVQQAASLSAVGTERPHKPMAAERHLGKREEVFNRKKTSFIPCFHYKKQSLIMSCEVS
jgi:serine/threonine protein kinase